MTNYPPREDDEPEGQGDHLQPWGRAKIQLHQTLRKRHKSLPFVLAPIVITVGLSGGKISTYEKIPPP